MVVVVDVAKDIGFVRRLAQVLAEMGTAGSGMKEEGIEQDLIIAEGALEIRQKFLAYGRRP